jgi:hypothetical protein
MCLPPSEEAEDEEDEEEDEEEESLHAACVFALVRSPAAISKHFGVAASLLLHPMKFAVLLLLGAAATSQAR